MEVLLWIFLPFAFSWYMWGAYLGVMALMRAHPTMSIETKIFAYPFAFVGGLADVLFNATIGSVLFLELPTEWVFTHRVSRWNEHESWRGSLARWICAHLLDPFDPKGRHCK